MGINFKTVKWLEKNTLEENLSMGVIGRQELNLNKQEKYQINQKFYLTKNQNKKKHIMQIL